jgi:hypothetical protein
VRVERLPMWGALGLDEATWSGLANRAATSVPFLTWPFQTTWWRHLGRMRGGLRGDEPYKYGFGAAPTDVVRITLDRTLERTD